MNWSAKRKRGFSLVELLAVLAIIAVCLALALPGLQRARDLARRNACKNNLKQVALAMHLYHEAYNMFPPGWIARDTKPETGPCYGWGAFVLPYVDQAELYQEIKINSPLDVKSIERLQKGIAVFHCPEDASGEANPVRGKYGTSNYSGNYGSIALPGSVDAVTKTDGIFCWNSSVRIRDVTDGASNVFLVGEKSIASAAGIWMGIRNNQNASDDVTACNHEARMNTVLDSFSSSHGEGAHFAICDGAVRFISEKIDSQAGEGRPKGTYQKLSNKSDGQAVGKY